MNLAGEGAPPPYDLLKKWIRICLSPRGAQGTSFWKGAAMHTVAQKRENNAQTKTGGGQLSDLPPIPRPHHVILL